MKCKPVLHSSTCPVSSHLAFPYFPPHGIFLIPGNFGIWIISNSYQAACTAGDGFSSLKVHLLLFCAIIAWFFIVDFPQLATFLKPDEKARAVERLNKDRGDGEHDQITFEKIIKHLSDWKLWGFALIVKPHLVKRLISVLWNYRTMLRFGLLCSVCQLSFLC